MRSRRPRYSTIDHTADLGILVRASSLGELFEEAALAMFDLLTDLERVELREEHRIEVEGLDFEDLLVRWLSELLSLHDAGNYLFGAFRVETPSATRLVGTAHGERLDPGRHRLKGELKAVTHHQALVAEDEDGWSARVVFDV